MRYPSMAGIHAYLEASYRGHQVMPGAYKNSPFLRLAGQSSLNFKLVSRKKPLYKIHDGRLQELWNLHGARESELLNARMVNQAWPIRRSLKATLTKTKRGKRLLKDLMKLETLYKESSRHADEKMIQRKFLLLRMTLEKLPNKFLR